MESSHYLIILCQQIQPLETIALKAVRFNPQIDTASILVIEGAELQLAMGKSHRICQQINEEFKNGINSIFIISKTAENSLTYGEHASIIKESIKVMKSKFDNIAVEGAVVDSFNSGLYLLR